MTSGGWIGFWVCVGSLIGLLLLAPWLVIAACYADEEDGGADDT